MKAKRILSFLLVFVLCVAMLPLLRKTKLRWMGKLMHSPMTMATM